MSYRITLSLLMAFIVSCSESSFTGGNAKNGTKQVRGGGDSAPGSADGSDGSNGSVGADGSDGSVTGADGSLTESFSFTGSTKSADILFALDTSGSMKEELKSLADKFSLFISEVKKFGIDANIVIIYDKSTEMDAISGQFKHHKAKVFSNDALCVIKDFFGNSSAATMLRDGVPLEVFVVTDDNAGGRKMKIENGKVIVPDQNECKAQAFQPPADKKTSFSGIIGLTAGKNTDSCNIAAVGEEYKTMAPQYGGSIYDLCTQDWAALVKDMADDLGQRIRKFKLKSSPNLTKGLTVMLNGKALQASEYTYDAASNTVTISASVISSATDKVEVKYYPK